MRFQPLEKIAEDTHGPYATREGSDKKRHTLVHLCTILSGLILNVPLASRKSARDKERNGKATKAEQKYRTGRGQL